MPLFLLTSTTTTTTSSSSNTFSTILGPIITLINTAVAPILTLVVAIGAIYCIFIGVKIAKAEEQQDREKAKQQLKNAIIGFLLIFVLIVALRLGLSPLQSWMNQFTAPTVS
ncbi:MAG: pilin [Clostridiales bacterium]|nr:pilin [Clostridiales bacterium]